MPRRNVRSNIDAAATGVSCGLAAAKQVANKALRTVVTNVILSLPRYIRHHGFSYLHTYTERSIVVTAHEDRNENTVSDRNAANGF
jgi:hypothetical protein